MPSIAFFPSFYDTNSLKARLKCHFRPSAKKKNDTLHIYTDQVCHFRYIAAILLLPCCIKKWLSGYIVAFDLRYFYSRFYLHKSYFLFKSVPDFFCSFCHNFSGIEAFNIQSFCFYAFGIRNAQHFRNATHIVIAEILFRTEYIIMTVLLSLI